MGEFKDIFGAEYMLVKIDGTKVTIKKTKEGIDVGDASDVLTKINIDEIIEIHIKVYQGFLKRKTIIVTKEHTIKKPAEPVIPRNIEKVQAAVRVFDHDPNIVPDEELYKNLIKLDKSTIISTVMELMAHMVSTGNSNKAKINISNAAELKTEADIMFHEGYGTALITFVKKYKHLV